MASDEGIPETKYGVTSTDTGQYSQTMTAAPTPGSFTTRRRPGYDFDDYDTPGERAEGFFVGVLFGKLLAWIGRLLGIATLDDPSGFLSTYREWHIFIQGLYAGFRAKTFGDVPECPPLWSDESQYFEGAAMFANVVKCQWPTMALVLAGFGAKVSGIV